MTLEDIQDTPHFRQEVGKEAVAGIGRTPKGLDIVLNADRLSLIDRSYYEGKYREMAFHIFSGTCRHSK
jgi:chemotaxis signal transduction protein